ncbi:hypothetical protein GCM10009539_12160 [Cryptosporangium japonicum]|uniref:Uncharacterized protein n=2 Tax=Cryptosporangium japonicum TaxID=80872 RepID=A0ABP3DEI6_9ACTN
MIAATALYAGSVTVVAETRTTSRRAARTAGAGTAAVVAGVFLLMILLAHVAYPATWALGAAFAVVATHRTLRADLGARTAASTAVGVAALVAASFVFVSYLAPMALIGALGVYRLLRLGLTPRSALVAMGGSLSALLAAAAATFAVALSTM